MRIHFSMTKGILLPLLVEVLQCCLPLSACMAQVSSSHPACLFLSWPWHSQLHGIDSDQQELVTPLQRPTHGCYLVRCIVYSSRE